MEDPESAVLSILLESLAREVQCCKAPPCISSICMGVKVKRRKTALFIYLFFHVLGMYSGFCLFNGTIFHCLVVISE